MFTELPPKGGQVTGLWGLRLYKKRRFVIPFLFRLLIAESVLHTLQEFQQRSAARVSVCRADTTTAISRF